MIPATTTLIDEGRCREMAVGYAMRMALARLDGQAITF
jgi:hypothetical protein